MHFSFQIYFYVSKTVEIITNNNIMLKNKKNSPNKLLLWKCERPLDLIDSKTK